MMQWTERTPSGQEDGASSAPLPRLTREAMVLLGLAMGGVAYGYLQGWLGHDPMVSRPWLVSSLALGLFALMCVQELRDRRLWASLAVVAGVVWGLNFSVVGWMDARWSSRIWAPWLLAQAALLMVALAWVQVGLLHRRLRAVPYASLFHQAWNNSMVLGFAALFVAVCWGILGLWAVLFMLVKVRFFADTFTQPLFACLVTGVMLGAGMVMARGQPRSMRVVLQLALAFFKLLLPMLALVVVLFVLFLPFTGVQPLWETGHAAFLLMGVQLYLMLLVNAVYQDGSAQQAPYPALASALVGAALLVMPLLAGLTVWAVALRVQQYGWTAQRVWAAAAAGVLLLYAVGYAVAALRSRHGPWLGDVRRINPLMSWVVMALLVLLHTPVLDPYRMGAHSQYARLVQGQAPFARAELEELRFGHGRHGLAAMQRLQALPQFAQPEQQALIQQVQEASGRHAVRGSAPPAESAKPLAELLPVAPGHASPPADWWAAMDQPDWRSSVAHCANRKSRCWVLQLALERGGPLNPLVCRVGEYTPNCRVYGRNAAGTWERVGQLSWGGLDGEKREALVQAIEAGSLQSQPPRWQEVVVPGAQGVRAGRVE
jgi:hypothetical protein